MTAISAVLFDMGGTLLSYENRRRIGEAFSSSLAELGLDPNSPTVVAARAQAASEVEARYARLSSFVHRDLFRDRFVLTAQLLGAQPPTDLVHRFDAAQRNAVIEHLVPMPGVHETLRLLRDRGLYLAVVSNADDDYLEPVLSRNGLTDLLDDWTSSEEARSCKPDPVIFTYSLAKAGVPGDEVLFVGDSPEHDVAGAKSVGFRTALIGEAGTVAPLSTGLSAAEPDWRIRELVELVTIVDGFA